MRTGWYRAVTAAVLAAALVTACGGRRKVDYKELVDDDPKVRSDAALRLGQAKAADGVASLLAVMDDPDEGVRINVVRALGDIGDRKATAPVAALAGDSVSTVRLAVTQTLGALQDPAGIPTLVKLLNDPDEIVRLSAARSLGSIPGDASIDALLQVALQDENETVRQHVVRVIRERRVREAIPRVERMLAAEAEIVRANAAWTLGTLGDRSSLPALLRALDDPYWKVRSLAAHALGKIAPNDPQVLAALRDHLKTEQHGLSVVDIAWNLARGGDRSGLDAIRNQLFHGDPEDIRAEAARALGEIGDASDVARLEKALADKKGLVRQEAYDSLHKLKKS